MSSISSEDTFNTSSQSNETKVVPQVEFVVCPPDPLVPEGSKPDAIDVTLTVVQSAVQEISSSVATDVPGVRPTPVATPTPIPTAIVADPNPAPTTKKRRVRRSRLTVRKRHRESKKSTSPDSSESETEHSEAADKKVKFTPKSKPRARRPPKNEDATTSDEEEELLMKEEAKLRKQIRLTQHRLDSLLPLCQELEDLKMKYKLALSESHPPKKRRR